VTEPPRVTVLASSARSSGGLASVCAAAGRTATACVCACPELPHGAVTAQQLRAGVQIVCGAPARREVPLPSRSSAIGQTVATRAEPGHGLRAVCVDGPIWIIDAVPVAGPPPIEWAVTSRSQKPRASL
jgi:hypothetical protein